MVSRRRGRFRTDSRFLPSICPEEKTTAKCASIHFFDHHGKAVVLTDREISEIMQQYKDGVLLSKIAFAQNLSCAMISRIVGFINRNKNRDIFAPQNQTK